MPQRTLLVHSKVPIEVDNFGIIYVEAERNFSKLYELREKCPSTKIGIALPRMFKPDDGELIEMVKNSSPDCILIRNLAAYELLKDSGIELVGDFSLNVTNSLSAAYLLDKGISRITLAYDLSYREIVDVIKTVGGERIEVALKYYMPTFYTEHCLFASMLSSACNHETCGRLCKRKELALIDERGKRHPVVVDAAWRSTIFNGSVVDLSEHQEELETLGVRYFRVM